MVMVFAVILLGFGSGAIAAAFVDNSTCAFKTKPYEYYNVSLLDDRVVIRERYTKRLLIRVDGDVVMIDSETGDQE